MSYDNIPVRYSTTSGYLYDAWLPAESWSADEWVLTRSRAVHLRGSGSRCAWVPLHALNSPELYAHAARLLGSAS